MKAPGVLVTFDDIPSGAAVFIDANCLVYAATSDPQFGTACQRLLEHIEHQKFQGTTSAHVLGDLSHRLMTIEAAMTLRRSMTGISGWLRRHPSEVQGLARYRQAIDDLQAIPIPILSVTGAQVSRAADLSRQFGLLTNDALVFAVMREHSLTYLASNDPDFDRVPGITRYAPILFFYRGTTLPKTRRSSSSCTSAPASRSRLETPDD
jgi:predicted nucleic acid-binding protein